MFDNSSATLSKLEIDLVDMYRLLPEDSKKLIFDLTCLKYTHLVTSRKTKVYLINVFRHVNWLKA